MEKHQQNRGRYDQLMLLEQVLVGWQHPVACGEALNLLHRAMCAVLYRCITIAMKTPSKVGVLFDCCFDDCCPDSCWGNTERVAA